MDWSIISENGIQHLKLFLNDISCRKLVDPLSLICLIHVPTKYNLNFQQLKKYKNTKNNTVHKQNLCPAKFIYLFWEGEVLTARSWLPKEITRRRFPQKSLSPVVINWNWDQLLRCNRTKLKRKILIAIREPKFHKSGISILYLFTQRKRGGNPDRVPWTVTMAISARIHRY